MKNFNLNVVFSFIVCLIIIISILYFFGKVIQTKNDTIHSLKIREEVLTKNLYNSNLTYILGNYLIMTPDGKRVYFKDLITEDYTVFRFSNWNCSICINKELSNINTCKSQNPESKIIIIASFKNDSEFYKFNKINELKVPIYNYSKKMNIFHDKTGDFPFYFKVSSHLIASDIFVPEKRFPDITYGYLNK